MILDLMFRKTVLAAFLLALAIPGFARAETGDVSFCFNDWPPYATLRDGKPAGISVEILKEAAGRADFSPLFRELPWKRCLEMVRDGEIDAVMDAMHRADYLQGPTSFSIYSNTVWVRADDSIKVLDFNALRGRKVGLVDGYEYPDSLWTDIKAGGAQVEYSVDDGTNIRKLAFGRVDAIVGDFASTMLFVRENNLNLRALVPMHSADRLYPSFNAGRGDKHKAIDRALQEMIEDGFIDRIYENHLGARYSEMNLPATGGNE